MPVTFVPQPRLLLELERNTYERWLVHCHGCGNVWWVWTPLGVPMTHNAGPDQLACPACGEQWSRS